MDTAKADHSMRVQPFCEVTHGVPKTECFFLYLQYIMASHISLKAHVMQKPLDLLFLQHKTQL